MSLGKYDDSEDMLDDYMMYKFSMEDGNDSPLENTASYKTRNSGGAFPFKGVINVIIILIIITLIYDAFRPKCAYPDCDNSPQDGSHYCALHQMAYNSGNTRSYAPAQTTHTTAAPVTTAPSNTTTHRTTEKTTTARQKDEYDAHEYADPEDFYEDHYDDFWDYEDAEDYWEDNY